MDFFGYKSYPHSRLRVIHRYPLQGERTFTYNMDMSKHRTIKVIQMELERLNREIDLKIIHGLSYRRESHRHKMLTSQLRHLMPSRFQWLRESFSHISFALF